MDVDDILAQKKRQLRALRAQSKHLRAQIAQLVEERNRAQGFLNGAREELEDAENALLTPSRGAPARFAVTYWEEEVRKLYREVQAKQQGIYDLNEQLTEKEQEIRALKSDIAQPSADELFIECAYCQRAAYSECAACGTAYCSKSCQRSDWDTHKWLCDGVDVCFTCERVCKDAAEKHSHGDLVFCSAQCIDQELIDAYGESAEDAVALDVGAAADGETAAAIEVLKQAAKKGKELAKKFKGAGVIQKTIRLVKTVLRAAVRVTETGFSIGLEIFGADTIPDAISLLAVELPWLMATLGATVFKIKSFARVGQILLSQERDPETKATLGAFVGGPDRLLARVEPPLEEMKEKNQLTPVCSMMDTIVDKVAGTFSNAIELAAVEFAGVARLIIYFATIVGMMVGGEGVPAAVRTVYMAVPYRYRQYFEELPKTVEMVTKVKQFAMRLLAWVQEHGRFGQPRMARIVSGIINKINPLYVAKMLQLSLAIGFTFLRIKQLCP